MNQQMRDVLAEDSWERMNVIEKLALAQARTDKRYRPITLEATNKGVGRYTVGGWDTFDLDIRDVTDGGRRRQRRAVVIKDRFADFVDHPDFEGVMIHIPATERNMAALASAHRDGKWVIRQDDIREQVAAASEKIVPVRNAASENAQPEHQGHIESEEEALKRRVAELEGQLYRQEKTPAPPRTVAQPTVPSEPMPEPDEQVSKIEADDAALTKRAKEAVHAEQAELIAQMKKKAKNYWLSREYKEKIVPLISAKKDELCTQPVK